VGDGTHRTPVYGTYIRLFELQSQSGPQVFSN